MMLNERIKSTCIVFARSRCAVLAKTEGCFITSKLWTSISPKPEIL